MDFDDYPEEKGIVAHRIVADGDTLYCTWEEANDQAEENIHKVEVRMSTGKDYTSRDVDLVNLINPVCFLPHFSTNLSLTFQSTFLSELLKKHRVCGPRTRRGRSTLRRVV